MKFRFLPLAFCIFALGLLPACVFKPSARLDDFDAYRIPQNISDTIPGIRITFLGTSTLLFDDGTSQILIDGFFSRPSATKVIFGKIQSDTSLIRNWMSRLKISRLKAVWVAHSHYDHLLDAPWVCKLTGATLYGSASSLNAGRGAGLPEAQLHDFESGRPVKLGDFEIRSIPSKHSPPFQILGKGNAPDPNHLFIAEALTQPAHAEDYVEGGCFDLYLKHGALRFLVKPSTNFIPGMLDTFPTDVLFLGAALLGKQNEAFRKAYFRETALATGCKTLIPIHWDNFMKPLSQPLVALPKLSDDVNSGLSHLIQNAQAAKIRPVLLQGGESFFIPFKPEPGITQEF